MSSAKEQFLKFNTLSCLIGQCVGYVTTVELRNEAFVTGKVMEVDGFMYVSVRCFLSREGSVVENQELTQNFIKYMHDIVLKISFLDVNSQNWNTGSHLKLWQVIVKIRHQCERISNIPSRG